MDGGDDPHCFNELNQVCSTTGPWVKLGPMEPWHLTDRAPYRLRKFGGRRAGAMNTATSPSFLDYQAPCSWIEVRSGACHMGLGHPPRSYLGWNTPNPCNAAGAHHVARVSLAFACPVFRIGPLCCTDLGPPARSGPQTYWALPIWLLRQKGG